MPKRRPIDKRDKLAIVLLLGSFVLMAIFSIRAIVLRGEYIPSERAYRLGEIVGYGHFIFLLAWAIWFFVKRKIHPFFHTLPLKERLWGMLAWPIFLLVIPFLTYWGSAMSIGFERHSKMETESSTVETISHKRGNKVRMNVVRNCVILTSDTLLRPQEVCGLTPQDWETVKPDTKIELFGTSSDWGFYVSQYRLLSNES